MIECTKCNDELPLHANTRVECQCGNTVVDVAQYPLAFTDRKHTRDWWRDRELAYVSPSETCREIMDAPCEIPDDIEADIIGFLEEVMT